GLVHLVSKGIHSLLSFLAECFRGVPPVLDRASRHRRKVRCLSVAYFDWDKCPLTGKRFTNPIILADGITYDAASLQNLDLSLSPILQTPMQHSRMISNMAIKTAISNGL
ncbi:MAG: hypothetical protein EOP45_16505, partial [Sphingobacteriaceae bacterium]